MKEKGYTLIFNGEEVNIPHKIGHGYVPIKILPLEELNTKYSTHRRLRVFHHKGLECVSCGKIGEYLIIGKDKGGSIHVDLYTKDFEWSLFR